MILLSFFPFSGRDFRIAAANAKLTKKKRKDPFTNMSAAARSENIKVPSLIAHYAREKKKLDMILEVNPIHC